MAEALSKVKEALEEAKLRIDELCICHSHPAPTATIERIYEALSALSALTQEAIGWYDADYLGSIRWKDGLTHGDMKPGAALYAHPQPAQQDARDAEKGVAFDFAAHLQRQRDWSGRTFGPGSRAAGVVDHIRKELREIEADPGDLKEWIDVVILALDGAWRSGAQPQEIIDALVAKQTKNEGRVWPDWRTADPNKAIEHDRSKDAALAAAKEKR